jgi:hypothetical protein
MAEMYRRMQAHFLNLDEDRLLKVYRQRAGMAAPGRDMGGWYDADGFVPGHLIGQFISGLSRIHTCTGDMEAAAKAQRLAVGYGEGFERDGSPYASAKASTWAGDDDRGRSGGGRAGERSSGESEPAAVLFIRCNARPTQHT